MGVGKAKQKRLNQQVRATPRAKQVGRDEITALLERAGDLVKVIRKADPGDKADLYQELGLKMTYYPQKQLVEARLMPDPHMCKWFVSEGGLEPPCPVKGTSTSS